MSDWKVGDPVVMRDQNERRMGGPTWGTVVKIGRALVHVADDRYPKIKPETFRIEDGTANDKWGGRWIQTPAEYDEEKERDDLWQRLRPLRDAYSGRGYTLDQMRRIVAIAEEVADDA